MIDAIVAACVAVGEVFGDLDEALYPEEEATVTQAVDKRQSEFRFVRGCARTALAGLGLARPPTARTQLGDKGLATPREVADRIAPALAGGAREDRGRIHGDLHRENMIELSDEGVGLIDFDDCGTGHYWACR